MKRGLAFAALSLLLGAGCGRSGAVNVTTADPTPIAPLNSGVSHGAAPDVSNVSDRSVFFERVLVEGGSPFELTGLGFLSDDSSTTTPFAFGVTPARLSFGGIMTLAATSAGVVYSQPAIGVSGSDDVISVIESSLESDRLNTVSSGVTWLATSGNGTAVAWVDSSGAAFVLNNSQSGSTPVALGLNGAHGKKIRFVDSRKEIWVETDQNQVLRFASPKGESLGSMNGASAVADVSGKHVAALSVDSKGAATLSVGPVNGPATAGAHPLALARATDLLWLDAKTIAYRGVAAGGAQEIHSVDIASGTEARLVSLAGPYAESGVTCPMILDGKLYFSDSSGASFAIYRVDPGHLAPAELFAAPRDENEGLICPVGTPGISGGSP